MARFDVYRLADNALVVDCQADLLSHLKTRVVAPLMPPEVEPKTSDRLNPAFVINGDRYVLYPQFMGTVSTHELGDAIASLDDRADHVRNAIDMLMIGF